MSNSFDLSFNTAPLVRLDELALAARQDHHYGNWGKWFHHFRGGVHAVHSRLYGVSRHYREVHAWTPEPKIQTNEYQLATILFHMDSALECLVFAMNALGFGVGGDFRDVADPRALKKIGVHDVVSQRRQPGYDALFPTLVKIWKRERATIDTILEQHAVSKHRETVYTGGQSRTDPPEGFFDALGLSPTSTDAVLLTPSAEILFRADPKEPAANRTSSPHDPYQSLESLGQRFVTLIDQSLDAVFKDATNNIPLASA